MKGALCEARGCARAEPRPHSLEPSCARATAAFARRGSSAILGLLALRAPICSPAADSGVSLSDSSGIALGLVPID